MGKLKYYFFVVDIGFILYWLITLLHLIPEEFLFKDYENEILSAWNWSFLPIDLAISFTGLLSIWLWKNDYQAWKSTAVISLALTFCSGLMAISFWVLRNDFDVAWWIPNLFLMNYPLFFLPALVWADQHQTNQLHDI